MSKPSDTTRPEVWFAIPSASVENCRRVLPVWREMGYKVAVLQNRERGEIPADIVRWSDSYPGWAESVNILCREVVPRSAPIVVSGGDDMLPDPHLRAEVIAQQFVEHFGGTFGVMQPHGDEYAGTRTICGSPWLGRAWIERAYGGRGPMPGMYHHNWSDAELYAVALGLGRLWSRADLSQHHRHVLRESGATAPAYWRAAAIGHDLADAERFFERATALFPGHEPIGACAPFDHAKLTDDLIAPARERTMALRTRREQLARALGECAESGAANVAIVGYAGQGEALRETIERSSVRVSAWIDPFSKKTSAAGVSIVDAASASGFGALVLISDGQDEHWQSITPAWRDGVPVALVGTSGPEQRRQRLERALANLRAAGCRRVALFGAGAHTAQVLDGELAGRGAIVAVLDERAKGELRGLEILNIEQARARGVDGVVLSSDAHERALWTASASLRSTGVRVERLYTLASEHSKERTHATA